MNFKIFYKKPLLFAMISIGVFNSIDVKAQCGYAVGLGCESTNYDNYGLQSATINNPITIEYDNYVCGFHSTIARTYTGEFKVWGEMMASNGVTNVKAPVTLNATNYPGLTGTVLKGTLASRDIDNVQSVILTTTGLFAWGVQDVLLDGSITSDKTFQKIIPRVGSQFPNRGISGPLFRENLLN